jgi:hypothetical protein
MMKFCERCLEEYDEGEIYPSKYFNKLFCIPCEKEYEMRFKQFRIEFMNNQAERLNPKDKNWFGMKAEIREGLCYFEDGTIIDPSKPIDVCDSPNLENKENQGDIQK